MDQFFNLIMNNMFIVIIVIAGLLKLFGGSKAKQNEQANEQQTQNTEQTERKSVFQQVKAEIEQQKQAQTLENERHRKETAAKSVKQHAQTVSLSVEEQRNAQLNRLKQSYQTASTNEQVERSSKQTSTTVSRSEITDSEKISLKLNKRLTQKGLIESVVMAEVLGSPRALKPYRNVASNRYR